jgi:hypothetical protein
MFVRQKKLNYGPPRPVVPKFETELMFHRTEHAGNPRPYERHQPLARILQSLRRRKLRLERECSEVKDGGWGGGRGEGSFDTSVELPAGGREGWHRPLR